MEKHWRGETDGINPIHHAAVNANNKQVTQCLIVACHSRPFLRWRWSGRWDCPAHPSATAPRCRPEASSLPAPSAMSQASSGQGTFPERPPAQYVPALRGVLPMMYPASLMVCSQPTSPTTNRSPQFVKGVFGAEQHLCSVREGKRSCRPRAGFARRRSHHLGRDCFSSASVSTRKSALRISARFTSRLGWLPWIRQRSSPPFSTTAWPRTR